MAAFADPQVKAIMPGTGGYGTTRILDKLDYEVIRKNPKILVGFSDITGLHIAINQKTGLVTFHSPLPEWGLGVEENLSPFAAKWFWRQSSRKATQTSPPSREGRGEGSVRQDSRLHNPHPPHCRHARHNNALQRRPPPRHAPPRQSPRPTHRRKPLGPARHDGHAV